MQGIWRHFVWDLDEETIKESQTLGDITRCIKIIQAYLLSMEITNDT